ncbi:MAG: ABC transporter substrate-binding protein [Alphaproteobacteria bacterium]|nr:ABC transporter substrate-binding protein [Alphaproteobacteria bacterium]
MRKLLGTAVLSLALAFAGTVEAQTPRRGGTVRLTAPYGASINSLDIHTTPRAQDGIYAHILHRTLYNWDTVANKPVLELAKDVKVSADGLVYTYTLRDDAYFHNGRRMTADDVIWTFTRLMDGSKGFPAARYIRIIKGAIDVEKGAAKEIAGLKKLGDFQLEVTLADRTDPGFSLMQFGTSILPRENVEDGTSASKPIGLGPFRFVEHVPGSRLVMDRWEKFYKPGKPYADRVVIAIMGEAAARDVAFRSKEIDVSILGPAQYVAYQADPALKDHILEVAEVFTRNMGMNPEFKPFADKRVRQAINHAIDTDLIIKRLVKDKAYRATSWLPLTSAAYDKSMKPYAYDPEKAKKLLADAGYPSGFEFEWTTSQNESWGLPIVEATIPMLARVGIKVKVRQVEAAVLSDTVLKGDFQAYIWSNQTGPDPLATMRCFHSKTPRTACNYVQFNNPAYDALFEKAAQTGDEAARNDILRQANALLYEEAPVWFFNYNKAVMAYQPWLHGLQANATELTFQYGEDLWVDEKSPVAK